MFHVDEDNQRVYTTLPDGTVLTAAPNDDPESKARARELGYGTDADATWRMSREHEIIHYLLALAEGKPCSSALWYAAHPDEPMSLEARREAHREECVVLFIQRCLNVGVDVLAGELSADADGRMAA